MGLSRPTVSGRVIVEARFADFTFTCELRLTGSQKPNSGIYFRVNPIQSQRRENTPTFEAASGCEYDVALISFAGSLGDWYAHPKLHILVDHDPNGSREGFIGLQIHNNAVMKIEIRKAQILPEA